MRKSFFSVGASITPKKVDPQAIPVVKAAINFTPLPKPHGRTTSATITTISSNNSPPSGNSDPSRNVNKSGLKPELYQKKDVGEDQNKLVRFASHISDNDLDWLGTLEQENGIWDMYRYHDSLKTCKNKKTGKAYTTTKNCDGSEDWSCGLNSYYHPGKIKEIKAKSVSQEDLLIYCREVYLKRKTAFYGYKIRQKHFHKFYLTDKY